MHLRIESVTQKLVKISLDYFSWEYIEELKLKSNFNESIVARYLISKLVEKYFKIKWYIPKVDQNWVPMFENSIYWSLSHKNWIIFVWVWDKLLWVDIEVFKERDDSLLNIFSQGNYDALWWKDWNNFYILWTGKEVVVKKRLSTIEKLDTINIVQVEKSEKIFDGISFTNKIFIETGNKAEEILFWKKDDTYYSVCI